MLEGRSSPPIISPSFLTGASSPSLEGVTGIPIRRYRCCGATHGPVPDAPRVWQMLTGMHPDTGLVPILLASLGGGQGGGHGM